MIVLREQVQRTLGSAYTVERELDGGGMSRALVATESALGRRVVIKVLPPELAAGVSVERFRREILLAAGLQHPHIVPVLSTGELDGLPYFIMPFVEGESLRTRLVRGRLSVPETVRILRDVARALAHAHERGIVHRDIKPDNVLLSSGSAVVADFGVARAVLSARARSTGVAGARDVPGTRHSSPGALTTVGTALGTPAYMAPEQAAADPAIDHRADLYAMGVMAYEMLTGATPFTGDTPRALLVAQLTEPPRPLSVHRPDIPVALQALVMRLLEKEPAHRPQTAADVVAALDDPGVVSGAFASEADIGVRVPASGFRRRGVMIGAIAAIAVGALAIIGTFTWRVRLRDGASSSSGLRSPVSGARAQSLAVLPLVNIGPDSGDAYLAAGLTDEVTTQMGKVRGLKVASRTAALAARTDGATVREIASRLGVSMLLEGTVQRAGKRVRVTARLLSASDGFTVWSDVYESESGDVLRVQDDIARALGEELVARDSTPTRAPTLAQGTPTATDRGAAHEHYMRGRFLAQQPGDTALAAAIAAYRAALGADSAYAPAHAGLAEAYVDLALSGRVREDSAAAIALAAGERAVALAPAALAHAGLADTAAAVRLLERGAAAHEPFFVVTPLSARALAPLRADPRFAALVRNVGAEGARPATR